MEVIRCVTEKTSLSSGQAAEDGPSQRRAPESSVPGGGLALEVFYAPIVAVLLWLLLFSGG